MRSRLAIVLFIVVSVSIVFAKQEWKRNIYTYDAFGYYVYLPAIFIYHDLGHLDFFNSVNAKYNAIPDSGRFSIYSGIDGRKNDKYAVGSALFELPLFLVAHAYALASGADHDGFSQPYQLAGIFSAILWVVIGFFVLRKFLLNFFSDAVVAVTLCCIAFGTNLFYYTTLNQGLSHPFSFFLFSSVLYCTYEWYESHKVKYLFITAILLALVIITRPVNFVIIIIPLFWGVYNAHTLRARIQELLAHRKQIILSLFMFLPIICLQLSYWKYTSGHWLYFSYREEGFDFLHPRLWRGLFSYRKGWFIYTPIAFSGMIGLVALWRKNRTLVPAITVFFGVLLYVVFSWKNWWYGGGFGCRPLIESLPVLALPLGSLIESVFSRRSKLLSMAASALVTLFIALNVFQTYQFALTIIHHDRMSRAYYWKVFGKTKINPDEYEKYLMDEHEYWRELNGISK